MLRHSLGDYSASDYQMHSISIKQQPSKKWILFASLTAVFYAAFYSLVAITTQEVQVESLLYGASGALSSAVVLMLVEACRNKRDTGTFWIN